jgi:hypothetical protein
MGLIRCGAATTLIGALEEAFRAARAAVAFTVVEVSEVEEAFMEEAVVVSTEEAVVVEGVVANQHFNKQIRVDGAEAFISGTERAFLTHISFLDLGERPSQDATFR